MQLRDRIGCRMKLSDLHVLMTVAQTGSMSKAAKVLNTGQPAISRSIMELEHALGVRLLDRSRKGIWPTECGRALLDGGTTVFDNLRQAVKNVSFLADPTAGEVRIGCNPFLAASIVSAAVDRLSRRFPRIVFRLVTAYVDALHRDLTERNVDLLITRRSGPMLDERLDYELLFEDTYSIVTGARNPWARRRKIQLSDLVNEPWVLPAAVTTLGSIAMDAFRASGLDYPQTTVIADPADVRISLLATGRYVSIFPESVLKFSAGRVELKVLHVKQALRRMPVGIVTLRNRTISPIARLFMDTVREVAKPLTKI